MAKFDTIEIPSIHRGKRPIYRAFIHCSASDKKEHDKAQVIELWHLKRKFKEIGYHFFINKNGDIQEGRSLDSVPAAQEGHNTGTIAICVSGLVKENFTTAQRHALKALCIHLDKIYRGLTFHGHCEVSAKECPVFDYKAWLGLNKQGVMI